MVEARAGYARGQASWEAGFCCALVGFGYCRLRCRGALNPGPSRHDGFTRSGRSARKSWSAVADLLARGQRGRPWTGWSFAAGWGSQEMLVVTLVEPELVVEVGVDVARDASGRWRHPMRWHRARPDLSPADVPRLTSPPPH